MYVELDLTWLNMAIAVVLPAVVAVITKRMADGGWKAITLLFLSALTAVLTEIYAVGGSFDLLSAVGRLVVVFAIATASHYGLLQPLKITGKDGAIQAVVPGGIG